VEEQARRYNRWGEGGRFVRRSAGGVPRAPEGRELVLSVIGEHAPSLLATARRYSLCSDDAYDAYQRALEIFLRRVETLEPSSVLPWLRTVVKHEALAVRAGRQPLVAHVEPDLDSHEDPALPTDEERIARFDRATRAAEALGRLKPQERTALVLKAEGHSYAEIADRTGWTYTKVNRCISEGRQRFLARYAGIESGAECERWAPLLSAVADGEASADQLLELRPHLRGCAACRATVREHHGAARKIAVVLPLGALPVLASSAAAGPSGDSPTMLARVYEAITGGLHERATLSALKLQSAAEVVSSGKVAAIAASTAALAGGGLVAQQALEPVHHVHRAKVHRVAVRHHRAPRRTRTAKALVDAPAPRLTPHPAPPPAPTPEPPRSSPPAATPAPSTPQAAPSPTASAPPPPTRDFAPEQPAASAPAPASTSRPSAPARSSGSAAASSGEFGP